MLSTGTSSFNGPARNAPGNISCAECRRSKLKCDRTFPCKTCIRRGCADICPMGTMPPVKGDIALKARAQKLTAEVDQLKSRVGELEAMLASGQRGDPRKHLYPPISSSTARNGLPMIASNDISDLLGAFPFGKKGHSYDISIFEAYMPTKHNAFHMTRLYYTRANYKTNIVASSEFYNTILDVIYGAGDVPLLHNIHPHKLSIFFATLALGGLCDEDSIIQELASLYDPVARAALSFCPLTTGACRATIQSIILITCLLHNQEVGISEECWLLNGINNRLVHQLEMHLDRDTSAPIRTPEELQGTRRVFWEVVTWDAWSSFMTSRPAYFSLKHIDCPYPNISVCRITNVSTEGINWKFKFTSSCIALTLDHMQSLQQPPPYPTILEVDQVIRAFPLPSYALGVSTPNGAEFIWSHDSDIAVQQFMTISMVEINLIFLHKEYLVRARKQNPDDPLSTGYRFSIESSVNSASRIVRALTSLYALHDQIAYLSWSFWSSLGVACAALRDVIVQSPHSKTAAPAMRLIDDGVQLYRRVTTSGRSNASRTAMNSIREEALRAISSSASYSADGAAGLLSKNADGPLWMHQRTYRLGGGTPGDRSPASDRFEMDIGSQNQLEDDITNWNLT